MFHKSLTLGAALLTATLLGFGSAGAMRIQTASPSADNVQLAAWGNRYYWHGGHGDWHGHGFWGPGLALGLGLGLTAPYYGYGYGPGYAYAGGSHAQWCLDHYRSYDPRTNTYIGADGYQHSCIGRY